IVECGDLNDSLSKLITAYTEADKSRQEVDWISGREITCPSGWTYFEKTHSCYKNLLWAKSFDNAEKKCKEEGGHLASIHSAEENTFITSELLTNSIPLRETLTILNYRSDNTLRNCGCISGSNNIESYMSWYQTVFSREYN
ncbi:hypothetical protein GCK32_020782, partial [Trichostrongylus colubriformis]